MRQSCVPASYSWSDLLNVRFSAAESRVSSLFICSLPPLPFRACQPPRVDRCPIPRARAFPWAVQEPGLALTLGVQRILLPRKRLQADGRWIFSRGQAASLLLSSHFFYRVHLRLYRRTRCACACQLLLPHVLLHLSCALVRQLMPSPAQGPLGLGGTYQEANRGILLFAFWLICLTQYSRALERSYHYGLLVAQESLADI